jgi:hypothetical protein
MHSNWSESERARIHEKLEAIYMYTLYRYLIDIHSIPYLREKGPMGSAPYIGSTCTCTCRWEIKICQYSKYLCHS